MATHTRHRGIDRAARAAAKGPAQRPWSLGHYTLPPLQPLSEDALERIHQASLTILQEIGLDMPSAVRLFLSQVVRTRSIPFELKAPGIRVTEVAVDAAHQRQMDEIGALWAQRKSEQG